MTAYGKGTQAQIKAINAPTGKGKSSGKKGSDKPDKKPDSGNASAEFCRDFKDTQRGCP